MNIYKITVGKYFYYGQTINKIETRWSAHKCDFKAGRHGNKILQRCWNKYGEAAFKHEHIYTAENKELLDLIEEELIDKYKDDKFCANICTKANSPNLGKGIPKSKEWKAKMSGSGNGRARAVEINGIKYSTVKEAAEALNTRSENIIRWLNGTRNAPSNFSGKYQGGV